MTAVQRVGVQQAPRDEPIKLLELPVLAASTLRRHALLCSRERCAVPFGFLEPAILQRRHSIDTGLYAAEGI